jgi:hypothetical protein
MLARAAAGFGGASGAALAGAKIGSIENSTVSALVGVDSCRKTAGRADLPAPMIRRSRFMTPTLKLRFCLRNVAVAISSLLNSHAMTRSLLYSTPRE